MIHSADYSAGGATFLIGSIGRGWPTHRTDFSRRSSVPIPREADEHSRFELTCACVCVRACMYMRACYSECANVHAWINGCGKLVGA